MNIGKDIRNAVNEWTGVGILVVIASVVLVKFKTSSLLCTSGYTLNTSLANECYLTTNSSITTTTSGGIGPTIDSFVAAFSEPKNWVAIVIIALIGFAILRMYNKRNK